MDSWSDIGAGNWIIWEYGIDNSASLDLLGFVEGRDIAYTAEVEIN